MGSDWAWVELTMLDRVWPGLNGWPWLSLAELAAFPLLLYLAVPSTCHLSPISQGSSLETHVGSGAWGGGEESRNAEAKGENMRGSKLRQGLVFRAPYNITISLGT